MRIFLLGATPSIDLSKYVTARDRLAATGGNTGNQLIAYGLLETLRYSSVSWDYTIGPERVNQDFDVIVVAAANFLFKNFDFGGMADFISRTNLPVVVAGLGAQSAAANNFDLELKPGTDRFLRVIAERSKTIGIRGEFTARALERLGITNFQIIGCPSYYMGGISSKFGGGASEDHRSLVAVHCSRDVFRHSSDPSKMQNASKALYREAVRLNAIFVCQTELPEIVLSESKDATDRTEAIAALKNIFDSEPNNWDRMESWFQNRTRTYWDVKQWINSLRETKLVIGTRIHGTIAALQASSPGICISHDARTSELCKFLSIPEIGLADMDLQKFNSLELLHNFDPKKLLDRRAQLFPQYTKFLESNGLDSKY
jgi:hypothetical protein